MSPEVLPVTNELPKGSPAESYDDSKDTKSLDGGSSYHADAVKFDTGVDVAVALVSGAHADDGPLDPAEARRIRNKLDWHLLPLLFLLYTGLSTNESPPRFCNLYWFY